MDHTTLVVSCAGAGLAMGLVMKPLTASYALAALVLAAWLGLVVAAALPDAGSVVIILGWGSVAVVLASPLVIGCSAISYGLRRVLRLWLGRRNEPHIRRAP